MSPKEKENKKKNKNKNAIPSQIPIPLNLKILGSFRNLYENVKPISLILGGVVKSFTRISIYECLMKGLVGF